MVARMCDSLSIQGDCELSPQGDDSPKPKRRKSFPKQFSFLDSSNYIDNPSIGGVSSSDHLNDVHGFLNTVRQSDTSGLGEGSNFQSVSGLGDRSDSV